MAKVPEYNRRSADKYNSQFDRCLVNLPKGSKARLKELTGLSFNKYASELIKEDLKQLEALEKAKAKPKAWDDMTEEEQAEQAFM